MCQSGRHFCGVPSARALLASRPMARAGRDAELPPLLPAPRRAARLAGRLRLRDDLPIVLAPSASDADSAAAARLREAVRAICGARLAIESDTRAPALGPGHRPHRAGGKGARP